MTTSMRERFTSVTSELFEENPRLALVLADIGAAQFRGLMRRHPDRAVNVGIREALMVSVAGGMALEGMRPIAHSYATFLVGRAFEQVRLDFTHQGVGGILVSVGASYDWTQGGRTHQAPDDVALVSAIPGWRVIVPGHADEAEWALRTAVASDEPVYIRLSERSNAAPVAHGPGLTVVRRGSDGSPTIVAVGPMLHPVIRALHGVDATLLYAAQVRPFDAEGLRAAVRGTEVVFVEPYLEGTSAHEIQAALSDRPIRLLSIGVPREELRRYGTPAEHDAACGLDPAGLRTRIAAWLRAGQPAEIFS